LPRPTVYPEDGHLSSPATQAHPFPFTHQVMPRASIHGLGCGSPEGQPASGDPFLTRLSSA
ncbi:MAG: hypothetical protein ACM3US_02310, partial [Sphingomonadaceae bacterium]